MKAEVKDTAERLAIDAAQKDPARFAALYEDMLCHHGRELLAEIQQLGYVGCYSRLAQLLSPWRHFPVAKWPQVIGWLALAGEPEAMMTTAAGISGCRVRMAAHACSRPSTTRAMVGSS